MLSRIIGFCGLIGALAIIYLFETSSTATGWIRIFHWPAMVLTGLGPFALVLLCFGFKAVLRTFLAVMFRSPAAQESKKQREAVYLYRLGKHFYQNGPGVFESTNTKGLSPFVTNVIDRLALRMPYRDIQELSLIERDKRESELQQFMNVLGAGVRLTPSIGMLGTIMGMVSLLATLDDPSHIGEHMSLALLTTFYGLFFSLALWTPAQQKMEKLQSEEMEEYDQTLRWLDLLEKRKPSDYLVETADLPKKYAQQIKDAA